MSDMASVNSYASEGLRLWADPRSPHGDECPCLICGDTREHQRATQQAESDEPISQAEDEAA